MSVATDVSRQVKALDRETDQLGEDLESGRISPQEAIVRAKSLAVRASLLELVLANAIGGPS